MVSLAFCGLFTPQPSPLEALAKQSAVMVLETGVLLLLVLLLLLPTLVGDVGRLWFKERRKTPAGELETGTFWGGKTGVELWLGKTTPLLAFSSPDFPG